VLGPKGESYKPEEAPGTDEATAHHRALAEAGVDLLMPGQPFTDAERRRPEDSLPSFPSGYSVDSDQDG
jgi:hypothetical protein